MATKKPASTGAAPKPGRVRIKSVALPATERLSVQDARKTIIEAVNALTEAHLKNFRGGQILIVK